MRRTERPSARFLGLLHGQAIIRGDSQALAMIEARAQARGIMQAVARHSSAYVVRRFSLDWMQAQDQAQERKAAPHARNRRDPLETADHPILRMLRTSGVAASQSRH